ncbi:MAG: ATP-dependent helicase RecG [Firmicutes bacterium]|nr:ATP-dependent helicase RecG [Bacillota bacterium]
MKIYDDISTIKGVGPKVKENLNKCLIFNVMDLILYFPRDYEVINGVQDGKNVVTCRVTNVERDFRTKTSKLMTTVVFEWGGEKLKGKWFNQPYVKNSFRVGEEYKLLGKVQDYRGETVMINPVLVSGNALYEKSEGRETILPKYPLKAGMTNGLVMKLMREVLAQISISENMPEWILGRHGFFSLEEAVRSIHFPEDSASLLRARDRLKFQELFTFSLKILALKEFHKTERKGISFKITEEMSEVAPKLSYELTSAQRRVLREILSDEKKPAPMNRLLQGDVGSGKTIVALISILNVLKNGYQAVLMAPTEILASQHYAEAQAFLEGFGVRTGLLCGSTTAKNKEALKGRIRSGDVDLVIGTHAVLEDDVEFSNLGLVVTDEQHRFGVMQRSRLINKDKCVDTLVMTATPIPRTLTLLLYGDLGISVIDELPPGRKKIETKVFDSKSRSKVYEFACREVKQGRQVYVVCPLIEENEKLELNSVEMLYGELKEKYFRGVSVGILHGKMNSKAKDEVMRAFKDNSISVLVSTTVIEVGVNVPNATIMVVENAERFGLAQLHQLRGRVGRGSDKSYCMLISASKSDVSRRRLNILKDSSDGFYIAEEDLKLRGGGEIFGYRQSGEAGFMLADLMDDIGLLKAAHKDAAELFGSEEASDKVVKEEFMKKIEDNSKYICFN